MKKLNKKNESRVREWVQQSKMAFDEGQLELCDLLCNKIIKLQPNHPEILHLLGLLAFRKGDNEKALYMIGKALKLLPEKAMFLSNQGMVLNNLERYEEAIVQLKKSLELSPNSAPAYNNLGFSFAHTGKTVDAIDCYQRAVKLSPGYAEAFNNLGISLTRLGRFEEAINAYRRAIEINPNLQTTHSNLLFLLSYYCMANPEEILSEHRKWDAVFGQHKKEDLFVHQFSENSGNRIKLRIGYLSSDFRRHPVSTFFLPLIENHHKERVEIYCYAEVFEPDEVTRQIESITDHWFSTIGKSDLEVAQQIFNDGIDILVDLNGHTAFSRLRVFTYKPAPIQVTYLGYCTTTGLSTMDYWVTDTTLHPQDTLEVASEEVYRLPRCWVAYQPPLNAPAVTQRNDIDQVTFGTLNNIHKLSDDTVKIWSEILNAVTGSHLLLKCDLLSDEVIRASTLERFSHHGISADRIELREASPFPDYLTAYGDIDIALDPFPRSGGTTTADALWMGVPVITIAGNRYVERLAASKLVAIGHEGWVASSQAEYVEMAINLANSPETREQLRVKLRDKVANSQLCDGQGLAAAMEDAFFDMWKKKIMNN